jgi:hypothetical protein
MNDPQILMGMMLCHFKPLFSLGLSVVKFAEGNITGDVFMVVQIVFPFPVSLVLSIFEHDVF